MFLLVGLGNPGAQYARTRHNIGFMVVDLLAHRARIPIIRRENNALVGRGTFCGKDVVLVKPQTFMNASGEAVGPLARRYGVRLEEILVIIDDMDSPTGRLRFRPQGSSGGHNGVKSIAAALGTEAFARLKVGIGRPERDAVNHVLSGFGSEHALIEEAVSMAADAATCFLTQGIQEAMNRFNGKMPESGEKD